MSPYLDILILQFIGIAINFFELIAGRSFGIIIKVIMYLLSVVVPIIIILKKYIILLTGLQEMEILQILAIA